jgi:hypothetical protein
VFLGKRDNTRILPVPGAVNNASFISGSLEYVWRLMPDADTATFLMEYREGLAINDISGSVGVRIICESLPTATAYAEPDNKTIGATQNRFNPPHITQIASPHNATRPGQYMVVASGSVTHEWCYAVAPINDVQYVQSGGYGRLRIESGFTPVMDANGVLVAKDWSVSLEFMGIHPMAGTPYHAITRLNPNYRGVCIYTSSEEIGNDHGGLITNGGATTSGIFTTNTVCFTCGLKKVRDAVHRTTKGVQKGLKIGASISRHISDTIDALGPIADAMAPVLEANGIPVTQIREGISKSQDVFDAAAAVVGEVDNLTGATGSPDEFIKQLTKSAPAVLEDIKRGRASSQPMIKAFGKS